ncbi:restriction endonuclease subunit S [Aliarcobacter butzleri]|uniref:restriction endonuclease subunit S n=1 Tax=Aliarcobacter butzleri TaxID=28197 RepID=UPI003B21EFFD
MAELYTLPDGWEWEKLENICIKITDGTHSTPKYLEQGIPFLSVKDISKGVIDFTNTRYISEEEHLELSKRCNVEIFDVLYTKVGTTGIAKVVDVEKQFSIFVSIALLKPKKDLICSFYLEYMLNSPNCYEQAQVKTRGVTNKNLVLKDIKEIMIPLPPLGQQKRIVVKLDNLFAKIDKAIALHQKNIDEANIFMASVLNDVFVELEEKYTYTKLKDVVTKEKTSIKRGPFGSALKKSFFVENGYLVYEQYHALNNDFSMERYYIDENKFNELKGFEVKGGDIIISCSGVYLGKLAIIPNEYTKGIINQALLKLSLNKDVISNELFVYFWNNLMNNGFFDEVKKGAAIPNMPSVKELKEIGIPLPPLQTQQKVVSYLDEISQKMEKIKQIQKEKMQSLKALKASILDQAFKGEL